jgi:pyruvate dehydrogenase E1 component alpha subunit
MVRCRALERQRKTAQTVAREALLAATAMQLQPGDLLCAEPGDPTPAHLAPQATGPHRSGELTLPAALAGRLALCAATARGLQAAATAKESGIVLAYTRARAAEPGWEKALAWAQAAQLPLLLACADATGGRGTRTAHGALDWASITRLHQSSKLAVISVDGEDAVALYRVMQECVLRARLGGGPAVLWAVMNPAHSLARAQQPVARLRSYMATRGIALG